MIPGPLAIFGELRMQVKSIKQRYDKFKVGPEKFQTLTDGLDLVLRHLKEIERVLQAVPNAFTGTTVFHAYLAHVKQTLKVIDEDEDENKSAAISSKLKRAFTASSSTATAHQVVRANALDAEMTAVMNKIDRAANQLGILHVVLVNVESRDAVMSMLYRLGERATPRIVTQANQDALMSTLRTLNETILHISQANLEEFMAQLKNMTGTSEEAYRPASNTPDPGSTAVLDFSPATSLGKLKQSVLHSGSSETVIAATGAVEHTAIAATSLAYGVLGMAGVGKTVALQALGRHEEVKKKFRDGVLYMELGREATLQATIGQIAKIMRLTGATAEVEDVRTSTSLGDAVDHAVMWFKGKICLYLIDDLWPAQYLSEKPEQDLPKNYFQLLRQLLRESPDSRMAISTRSLAIATEAESVVDFSPGETLGRASVDIFMAHATFHLTPRNSLSLSRELRSSVATILSICSGLPIALSVTGRAVSKGIRQHGTFEKACDAYVAKLQKRRTLLGHERTIGGASLNTGILLSLESLEVEFSELVSKLSIPIDHNVSDLYSSLCVLSNQTWLPVSVLGLMWKLDKDHALNVTELFCDMSLATLDWRQSSSGRPEEPGIVLHDLLLDFCQQHAEAAKTKKPSFWHTQLLNGYWKTTNHPQAAYTVKRYAPRPCWSSFWPARMLNGYWKKTNQPRAEDPNAQVAYTIMSCVPRPWWSYAVPEDGYIHTNLARHLSGAGQNVELAALLLDARWTEMRGRIGGILALKSDFAHLGKYLSQLEVSGESIRKVQQSFEAILKAVRLSWGRLPEGMRAFQFQVCGRLQSCRESNAAVDDYLKEPKSIVDAYLKRVVMTTPKPFLVPVSAFFTPLGSGQILEIPVGGECSSVACSPCGRYIAAGAGRDILIAKASSGEVLQRMRGHISNVTCMAFVDGSKEIVSGAEDGKIIVWEWDSSSSPMRVLQSEYAISCLAVHTDIMYSMERGVRAWDVGTGDQSWEVCALYGDGEPFCLALCGKNRKIALGTELGELIVLDIDTNAVVFEVRKAHKSHIVCGAFSPNGQYLATGSSDSTICLWDASARRRWGEMLKGHEDMVNCVCFSPDGARIASASEDGTVRIWDFVSGQCIGSSPQFPTRMRSISFISDRAVISGSYDGIVRIWDACLEDESEERCTGHTTPVLAVSVSRSGLKVATASYDNIIRLWDAQTGELAGELNSESFYARRVVSIALSPDGRKLVSSSSGSLVLWNTEACTQIWEHFSAYSQVRCASFSCDGLRIISRSDREILIWSAKTLNLSNAVEYGGRYYLSCLAESVDGRHIVCQDRSRRTTIRNRETMKIIWDSEAREKASDNCIPNGEAETIIRSCGQYAQHLWPKRFPAYSDELYWKCGCVYSNLTDGKTVIAEARGTWAYNSERKVLAFGLEPGGVAICQLAMEKPFRNFENFSKLKALLSTLQLVLDG